MSDVDANQLPEDFTGTVRLFPLPNLVLFPNVVQPLHIFEPRYREMLEDSLAADQLIAIALLQPGWEADYDERPSIFPVTCIGRVVSHSRLEDGRYNLLLLGLRRASVIRELPATTSYRMAEVAVLEDVYSETSGSRRVKLQRDLIRRAVRRLEYIHIATTLDDLKTPPSNRLHALKGDRKGQHSISNNEQWRICFRFVDGDAFDVEITDYH